MGKIWLPREKQIPLGQLTGVLQIDKFGESNNIDVLDSNVQIWDRDHNLTYLSSPSKLYISSSVDTDDISIKVIAMLENKKYVPILINLDGFTPVDLSTGYSPDTDYCVGCKFLRVVRMTPSNGDTTDGNVYIASNNTNHTDGVPLDAEIQAWFAASKQQTQMSHFTVPTNYYALLTTVFVGIINNGNTSATNADVILHTKHITTTTFINKWTLPVSDGGPVIIQGNGRYIKPETDIHLEVLKVGRSSTKVACSYTLELYRTDIINTPIVLD